MGCLACSLRGRRVCAILFDVSDVPEVMSRHGSTSSLSSPPLTVGPLFMHAVDSPPSFPQKIANCVPFLLPQGCHLDPSHSSCAVCTWMHVECIPCPGSIPEQMKVSLCHRFSISFFPSTNDVLQKSPEAEECRNEVDGLMEPSRVGIGMWMRFYLDESASIRSCCHFQRRYRCIGHSC